MSEAQDLIDEFNMWIERGTMPRMTAANTLILLEEIKRLTAEAEKWRNTALQLSNNHGQARNKVDNLEADYIISNRELLILQVELSRRDELIKRLVEDGERFEKRSIAYVYPDETPPYYECQLCFHDADEPDNILHDKSCPITLHRALIKELE